MGDALAEGRDREGHFDRRAEEEEDCLVCRFHSNFLSGNMRQAVQRATGREGGSCLLLRDVCTKTGRPVADVLQEKHPDMRVPPVESSK